MIPREAGADWRAEAKDAHAKWWEGRIARQREIDAFIAKAADIELLYNRPYEDKARMRVAGPFTVESLSPHRAGDALPRRVAPVRTAWHGSHRGEGDQPLRRRGDEGGSGMRLGVQV